MNKLDLSAEMTGIGRVPEITALLEHLENARCCSLVGVSNMGKSRLLRALTNPALLAAFFGARASRYLVLYVDCNRMLHLGEQGFYELILRCLREALAQGADLAPARALLEQAYADVVQPTSPLAMPLAFNRAVSALLGNTHRSLMLLLDEFDDPLRTLDGRVLLNLRALKDQYADRLAYITATCQPLDLTRDTRDAGVDEFCELFAAHICYLGPMTSADSIRLLVQQMAAEAPEAGGDLSSPVHAWPPKLATMLAEQAGGHAGLLCAGAAWAAQALEAERTSRRWATTRESLAGALDQDPSVQTECVKLWEALAPQERRAIEELASLGTSRLSSSLKSLQQKGLVRDDGAGLRLFAPLWERYILRQRDARRPTGRGVQVDVESNEAWVDGRPIPYLTPLESRLLQTLYEHVGQVCTKEAIIEAVYGRPYIENDDPALQRLVRRLREKIEPDPSSPAHILSVRGYGYKLAEPTAE